MTKQPHVLERLSHELVPSEEQRLRVRARVMQRVAVSAQLTSLISLLDPSRELRQHLWSRILQRIAVLTPAPAHTMYRFPKWVAAFVLVLVMLRASPMLFLAPGTSAQSSVILLPTRGEIEISLNGLWQPLQGEITIDQPMQIRTGEGEATVLLHDDGTVRLAPFSTITLSDLSDRPEPGSDGPTLALEAGQIWLQGLLPDQLRGMTVAAASGNVLIHGGSLSLSREAGEVALRVWDRHAHMRTPTGETLLVAGEKTVLEHDGALRASRIADGEYEESWVAQNLQRDAVHQREVAQMQQERRAARAGILPTSPFYSVKRVAEQMDVLLTIGSEARMQKKLEQATTRLDEAAVLLAEGNSGAVLPLSEYTETLREVASGSGVDLAKQELLKQQITENAADLGAALPGDDVYLVKQTVLTTAVDLPVMVMDESDVKGTILLDGLDVLREAVESSDEKLAKETYDILKTHLVVLHETGSGSLRPEVQKEVTSLLSETTDLIRERPGSGILAAGLADELSVFLPAAATAFTPMTEEEITALVQGMYDRIFSYKLQRSRWNQLLFEMRAIEGHPEEGRILRRLYHALPEDGIARYVRTAIQQLRDRQAGM